MSLDLSPLARAVEELDLFLGYCREEQAMAGGALSGRARAFRAAAIQAFEFTYELCCKMLRRFLEAEAASPTSIGQLGLPDLIRTAYARGLVRADWRGWSRFREMRNISSHTYDGGKAAQVLADLPDFLVEARYVLAHMQAETAT